MNYRHIYMLIIEHAKSEEKLGLRTKGNGKYYERHHILPRSLFPLWLKRKSNLVLLTAREHFFCHQLLTKIYPCKQMLYAITAFSMRSSERMLTSRQYAFIKEYYSLVNQGKDYKFNISKEEVHEIRSTAAKRYWDNLSYIERTTRINQICETNKMHKLTEEAKNKLSELMRQHNLSYSFEKRSHASKLGHTRMSDETKSKLRELARQRIIEYNLSETEEARQQRLSKARKASSKKIKCLNDNRIFDSITAAANYYNITRHAISNSIHKNINSKLKFIILS